MEDGGWRRKAAPSPSSILHPRFLPRILSRRLVLADFAGEGIVERIRIGPRRPRYRRRAAAFGRRLNVPAAAIHRRPFDLAGLASLGVSRWRTRSHIARGPGGVIRS